MIFNIHILVIVTQKSFRTWSCLGMEGTVTLKSAVDYPRVEEFPQIYNHSTIRYKQPYPLKDRD